MASPRIVQRVKTKVLGSKARRTTPTYMFVTGCPRSGTTALSHLLNSHPQVVCGIERYKYLARDNGPEAVTKALFTPDRFLDFRPSDTNILPWAAERFASVYSQLALKLHGGSVEVIGDKLPDIETILASARANFPRSRIVFIVRDPVGVAGSFVARRDNPNDAWTGDETAAVRLWNQSVRRAIRFANNHPKRLFVVRYEELYVGDATARRVADQMFRFLGLTGTPETDLWLQWSGERTKGHGDKPVSAEGERYLKEHIDWKAHDRILQLAAQHAAGAERG